MKTIISQLSPNTEVMIAGRKYKLGGSQGQIVRGGTANDGGSGWIPWNHGDPNGDKRKDGLSCYPKLGGKYQEKMEQWFPMDQEVVVS